MGMWIRYPSSYAFLGAKNSSPRSRSLPCEGAVERPAGFRMNGGRLRRQNSRSGVLAARVLSQHPPGSAGQCDGSCPYVTICLSKEPNCYIRLDRRHRQRAQSAVSSSGIPTTTTSLAAMRARDDALRGAVRVLRDDVVAPVLPRRRPRSRQYHGSARSPPGAAGANH